MKRLSHTWVKRFIQSEFSCQNESVSSQRVHVVGASSILGCRVSTSLLPVFSQFAINHRQWRKVRTGFIALDKPIKKHTQEEQHKKTRAKTRRDVPQTEGGGKESFKEGKCAVKIIDDKEFYTKQGNVRKLQANDLKKALPGKQIKRN